MNDFPRWFGVQFLVLMLMLIPSAKAQDSTAVLLPTVPIASAPAAGIPATPSGTNVHDSVAPTPVMSGLGVPVSTVVLSAVPQAETVPAPRKAFLKRLPPVAVLSFTGSGVEAKDLASVTNRFESELLASDSFKIVERRNIDKILKEQGFQQSGACDNSECSVGIGQLLSVQGIFTGELTKTGKLWSLSVKCTDVGTGQTQFSHVLDIQGSLSDVLRGGVPEMALIASGKKKPENSHTVLVAKSEGSLWPWLAGGVVLAGGATAAVILLTQDKSNAVASTPAGATTTTRTVEITFDTGK